MLIVIISLLVLSPMLNAWLAIRLSQIKAQKALIEKEHHHLSFKVVRLQEECKAWKESANSGTSNKKHSVWKD